MNNIETNTHGRAAHLTLEEVTKVADDMRAAGQPVTTRSVRTALNRGSNTTIYRFLEVWQTQQARATATPTFSQTFSASLQEEVNRIEAAIWSIANAAIEASKRNQTELAEHCDQLAQRSDDLTRQIEQATIRRDDLQRQLDICEQQNNNYETLLKREISATEAARTELARYQFEATSVTQRLVDISSELRDSRQELAEQSANRVKAEQEAAVLTARHQNAENQIVQLDARNTSYAAQLQLLNKDLESAKQETMELRQQLHMAALKLQTAEYQAATALNDARIAKDNEAMARQQAHNAMGAADAVSEKFAAIVQRSEAAV